MPLARSDLRRELAHKCTARRHALHQLAVSDRIAHVDTRSEHADRLPALERAMMRRRIDPLREPADDRETGGRDRFPDAIREAGRTGCARASADDRDARRQRIETLTADVQQWRRSHDLLQ